MFAVRVIYPKRRGKKGKRDLVVQKSTRAEAIAYAKRAAARGKRYSIPSGRIRPYMLYAEGANNSTACVYNMKKWGTAPACFRFKWVDTYERKRRGIGRLGQRVKTGFKAASVVKVPYTALGRYR